MSYNSVGEQIGKQTFNNEAIVMAYDSVGRAKTVTLPDRTRTFSYTDSGQIGQIVDGSDTWTFSFDARDRLTRAEDAFGRAIDYRYDAAGNRTELKTCTLAGATCTSRQQVQYDFDELNRLRQVVARLDGGIPQTTQYRYSDVGNRSGMTHPNGTVVDYQYDVRNRLKSVRFAHLAALAHKASALASAATLLALSYTVDAAGLRTQIAETRPGDVSTPTFTRVTDYVYDGVDRLIRETVSGNHGNPDRVHSWTYDAVGNRLTQTAVVGAVGAPLGAITTNTTYDYDQNDRLLTETAQTGSGPAVTTTSTYDNAGNVTESREGATTVARYTWDAEGRLIGAVTGSGASQKSIAYRYDPNGIRRSQVVTDATGVARTEYLVDPNQTYAQVLEEWSASAASGPLPDETLATTYVYGDDLISQTKLALAGAATTSVYHYDGLGTTRALSAYKVDAAGVPQAGHGEITDRYTYTAFGESDPAGTSGDTSGSSENNYRYTGEQLDPNLGFYYLRARYMDPAQGRFLGMDPWEGVIASPLSIQKYLYASSQAVNRADPSGHMDLTELELVQQFQTLGRQMSLKQLRKVIKKVVTETIQSLSAVKTKVRKCLRSRRSCDIDAPVLVIGGDLHELAGHILHAQIGAGTNFVPAGFQFAYKDRVSDRDWYNKTPECGKVARFRAGPGVDCDEFPMYTMNRGGLENHPTFVSLRLIDSGQNRTGGVLWKVLKNASGMDRNPRIRAIVIAWDEIPLSVALPLNRL